MFNTPSQHDVRRFWCQTLAKLQANASMDPMQTIAAMWLQEHAEYHAELADEDAAVARDYSVEGGQANPFLHLSMHLSLSEQCSIDQPRGVRAAVERLTAKHDDLHHAHHLAMEAMGQMVWESQRQGTAPDGAAYVAALRAAV